ncbi:MAG: hypothetical protein Q8O13_05715 [Candidatus Omnitrophota bacterium]|nr:hypothetical protein [Candidatus Omnitrophota bacterium]
MEGQSTPEERLLKLIRNKNKEVKATTIKPTQSSGEGVVVPVSKIVNLRYRLAQKVLTLKNIHVILFLVIGFLLSSIIFQFFFSQEERQGKSTQPAESNLAALKKDSGLSEPVPLDYYSKQIAKRDIFKSPLEKEQPSDQTSVNATLQELIANLRLTGIILDKQPQAIIEDTKTKKTYFLNKGDYIGDIKVEEIQESKVILIYQEEKIELVP